MWLVDGWIDGKVYMHKIYLLLRYRTLYFAYIFYQKRNSEDHYIPTNIVTLLLQCAQLSCIVMYALIQSKISVRLLHFGSTEKSILSKRHKATVWVERKVVARTHSAVPANELECV